MAADFEVTFQNVLAAFDYAIRDKPERSPSNSVSPA